MAVGSLPQGSAESGTQSPAANPNVAPQVPKQAGVEARGSAREQNSDGARGSAREQNSDGARGATSPHIRAMWVGDNQSRQARSTVDVSLRDRLVIQLSTGAVDEIVELAANKQLSYGLLVGGRFLGGAPPERPDADLLAFSLDPSSENRPALDLLVAGQLLDRHLVTAEIGLSNGEVLARNPSLKLRFSPMSGDKAVLVIGAGLLLLITTFMLARRTAMLRDTTGDAPNVSWSLGRVQMAVWFVNIVLAYLFLWAVCGTPPVITTTALTLLGIGGGTALASASIDASRQTPPSAPTVPPTQAPESRLPPVLGGDFLRDLLWEHDSNSVSFHRFQMVVWTVIGFFVFWSSVVHALQMPELDGTFLALQGITAGTYLGFKLPAATKT